MKMHRRNFLRSAGAASAASLLPAGFWASVLHAQPNDGKTLVITLPTNPITIDPINQLSHDVMVLGQTVFENLIEYDVDGNLVPQLAEAMPEVSEDQLSFTFKLRPNVKFHNGKPLTAEDVAYSFNYMLDPENKAARRNVFSRLKGAEAIDEHTVRIDMNEPYSPWLCFMSKYMGIFPVGSREEHGGDYFRLSPKGVGTGVGIFEEWIPDTSVTFLRNPEYWREGLPAWEKLVVKVVPDTSSRLALLQSGEVDIVSAVPPQDYERLKAMDGIDGDIRPTTAAWLALFPNNAKAPFDDVKFRQAISFALDRALLASEVYQGYLDPTAVAAPPKSWWYNDTLDAGLAYDLEKAKALLAESKYPTGASFELQTATNPYMLETNDCALFIQALLAEIGVNVTIVPVEFNVLISGVIKGEHMASVMIFASPGEPTYAIQGVLTAGQTVAGGVNYANTAVAELLSKAFATTDRDVQLPIYHEIQKVIAEDMPVITLGFASASGLWRDRVKNYKLSQGITMNVTQVSV